MLRFSCETLTNSWFYGEWIVKIIAKVMILIIHFVLHKKRRETMKDDKKEKSEQRYMERIRLIKDRVVNTRPEMDLENAKIMTESFKETAGEPLCIRKAKAFRRQCREKTVKIWDQELIVGCSGSKMRGGIICADTCWSVLDDELETISERKYDPFYLREEDKELFLREIKPYWEGRSTYEAWLKQIPDGCRDLRDTGQVYINRKAVRGWGETTAGYRQIIEEGIESICDTIRARKEELLMIASNCHRVPRYPARTFYEALQSLYIYQICIFMEQNAASYNPGRMDQYLYPFYKKDIEEGILTEEKAQELLDCLWAKFSEPCLFQDAVNPLSYLILQATMDVQLYQPSLSVRYSLAKNPNNKTDFYERTDSCIGCRF